MVSKKLRELTINDTEKITNLYEKHISASKSVVTELGLAKSVSLAEIQSNDYSFVPGRYVGVVEQVIDKDAAKQEIQKIAKELDELFAEFNTLAPRVNEAIKKALES